VQLAAGAQLGVFARANDLAKACLSSLFRIMHRKWAVASSFFLTLRLSLNIYKVNIYTFG
jgi:hypothetical protein